MTNITKDELIKFSLGFWGEDYAEAPVQQLAKELISARAEIVRLRSVNNLIAPWLSAAINDPLSGVAFKRDASQWLEAQTQ